MGRSKRRKPAHRVEPRNADPAPSPFPPDRRALIGRLAMVAVPLLAAAVYAGSLDGDFVWDDRALVVEDHMIKSFDHLGHLFSNDFFFRNENDLGYGYYRPITTLTYVTDWALWADDPFGYHLTNLLLHVLCTVLALLLLRRLGFDPLTSALAGALFAVHPIHSENVAWIAGRTDLMAFALAGIAGLLQLRAWAATTDGRRRSIAALGAAIAFGAALLAKEMAIVLIPWLFLERWVLARARPGRALRAVAPLAVVATLYLVWRFALVDVPIPGQPEVHTPSAMLLSVAPTVGRYLSWLVAPLNQSAYVQNPYVTSLLDWRLGASLLVFAALAVLVWRKARSAPQVLFAVGAAVVSFGPIAGLVRVAAPDDMGAVMAERFAYFPSLWLMLLVALGWTALGRRFAAAPAARWGLPAVALAVLVALSAATISRNRIWHDEPALFNDALAHAPDASLLWGNLATYHLREGNLAAAEDALARLDQLDDESYFARSARALWHVMAGRTEDALALQERIVASSRRHNQVSRNNLAYLYRVTGRVTEARALLDELIDEGHGYSDVRFNLAEILRRKGDMDGARTQYRLALAEKPDDLPIGTTLAQLELQQGNLEAAAELFEALLALHPLNTKLLNNLAVVQRRQGRAAAARATLKRALEIDPGYERARRQLQEIDSAGP